MDNTKRRIQFQSLFKVGTGTQVPAGTEIPLVATIEYERNDPTSLDVDLLLLGNTTEQGAAFLESAGSPAAVRM
jgi:hypothetical protein